MLSLLVSWLTALVLIASAWGVQNPEDFVNLLAGTFTDGNVFSTGNTLPLVGYPWGFNHWAPQTAEGSRHAGSWWFHGSEHRFTFMRCTHQPSPWIGDWGWFLFGPQMGQLDRSIEHAWEPRAAVIRPYLFDATVAPWGIRMELAPSMHGSMFRVTFPNEIVGLGKRVCFAEASWGATGHLSGGQPGMFITGRATQINSERFVIVNFGMHIRAESAEAQEVENHGELVCFRYMPSATVVTVRIATSLISPEQAQVSLAREIPPTASFEEIKATAKGVWNTLLKRVDVVDPGDLSGDVARHLTVFYSGLVRALSFPRQLEETDAQGRSVHYSPYNTQGRIFQGPLLTDNGFWDTFRTVYPMLALCYPDHLGRIIQGWLNAFKEGGWLPSWSSPGYRNSMVGTYGDVIVGDAIVKGIRGFDLKAAELALLKDAFEAPPSFAGGAVGKEGLKEYADRGYFAMKEQNRGSETVSRTLDFGFADFAAANALRWLSANTYAADPTEKQRLEQIASTLTTRSDRAYRSMFDRGAGLMLPKREDGQRTTMWNEVEWGNGYTEGNAWHHSFPPYGLAGLVELHGSSQTLISKLRHMLNLPSHFMPGSYGQVIHEMLEARALAMGQYGHNNQPVHHILYLLAQLGDRETMETAVRKVMDRAYGVDFFAGDEDNGEQGAWFVLSALGLYATTPGTPNYVLGTPLFRHVRIARPPLDDSGQPMTLPDGKLQAGALDIVATGTSAACAHVTEVEIGPSPGVGGASKKIDLAAGAQTGAASLLSYDLLNKPGVLRFVMCNERRPDGSLPAYAQDSEGTHVRDEAAEKQRKDKEQELVASLKQELSHSHGSLLRDS